MCRCRMTDEVFLKICKMYVQYSPKIKYNSHLLCWGSLLHSHRKTLLITQSWFYSLSFHNRYKPNTTNMKVLIPPLSISVFIVQARFLIMKANVWHLVQEITLSTIEIRFFCCYLYEVIRRRAVKTTLQTMQKGLFNVWGIKMLIHCRTILR